MTRLGARAAPCGVTTLGFLVVAGLALSPALGCKKQPAREDPAAAETRAKQEAEHVAHERAAIDARRAVDTALKGFGAAPDAEARRTGYLALLETLTKSKALVDPSTYKGLPFPAATPLLDRLAAIAAAEATDEKDAPNVPSKPEHDPPKYTGAFQLSGQVRKCYKDGVVLQSGAKFYFLADAKCPDVPYLYGYVQDDGRTVDVDIGRGGREATVVTIGDKESASDDRAAHRKAVVEYEADYAAKLKEYQDARRGNEAALAGLEKRRAARKAERDALSVALDAVLLPLARAAASGADLSAVKPPEATPPTLSAIQPAPAPSNGSPRAVAPKAPGAAPTGPGLATPQPAAKNPRARSECLSACVAKCADDAACERTCAGKCPS